MLRRGVPHVPGPRPDVPTAAARLPRPRGVGVVPGRVDRHRPGGRLVPRRVGPLGRRGLAGEAEVDGLARPDPQPGLAARDHLEVRLRLLGDPGSLRRGARPHSPDLLGPEAVRGRRLPPRGRGGAEGLRRRLDQAALGLARRDGHGHLDQRRPQRDRGDAAQPGARGHAGRGARPGLSRLPRPGPLGPGHAQRHRRPRGDARGGERVEGGVGDGQDPAERLDPQLRPADRRGPDRPLHGLRPPLRLRPAGPGRGGRAVPSRAVQAALLGRLALDQRRREGPVAGRPLPRPCRGRGEGHHGAAVRCEREPGQLARLRGLRGDVRHRLRHLHVPGLAWASRLRGDGHRHHVQRPPARLGLCRGRLLGHAGGVRHEAGLHGGRAEVHRRALRLQRRRPAARADPHPIHACHRGHPGVRGQRAGEGRPARRRPRLAGGRALRHAAPLGAEGPGGHLAGARPERLPLRPLGRPAALAGR
mmetsp:Transcript_11233/g.33227  ORF Transcript_11233/g.33227 Transcript_11233/m.33227 type:complete len:475 (-) Transcript_11233:524-1948(-)